MAVHSLDPSAAPIKEYQIATEVFGRPADFDPRMDSTVRVQTGRLRSKLAEYYGGPGAEDQIIIELPKGNYALTVHERAPVESPTPVAVPVTMADAIALPKQPESGRPNPLVITIWALGIAVTGLVLALLLLLVPAKSAKAPARETPSAAVATFWHGFLDQSESPLVVFGNVEFIGSPERGMRYFDPERDSKTEVLDHYTGVGEVIAVHDLDRLFESLGYSIRLKRGRLLSIDDAKNNDLILLGSPGEILSLRDVPGTQDFIFRSTESGPRKGDLAIVNVKPLGREPGMFRGSSSAPITEDYALIGLVPGMNTRHWVMVLAGTTTVGTQAAVELVTRARNLEELVNKIGVKDGGVRAFEAVIKVRISGGVPVNSEIVAIHPRT